MPTDPAVVGALVGSGVTAVSGAIGAALQWLAGKRGRDQAAALAQRQQEVEDVRLRRSETRAAYLAFLAAVDDLDTARHAHSSAAASDVTARSAAINARVLEVYLVGPEQVRKACAVLVDALHQAVIADYTAQLTAASAKLAANEVELAANRAALAALLAKRKGFETPRTAGATDAAPANRPDEAAALADSEVNRLRAEVVHFMRRDLGYDEPRVVQ